MARELKDLVSGGRLALSRSPGWSEGSAAEGIAGRLDDNAITLFESQGVAIEDVAAALHVYRKARERGMGQELPF